MLARFGRLADIYSHGLVQFATWLNLTRVRTYYRMANQISSHLISSHLSDAKDPLGPIKRFEPPAAAAADPTLDLDLDLDNPVSSSWRGWYKGTPQSGACVVTHVTPTDLRLHCLSLLPNGTLTMFQAPETYPATASIL